MRRVVWLLLFAGLGALLSAAPVFANGAASTDVGAITSESEMEMATGAVAPETATTEQSAVAQPGVVTQPCPPGTTQAYAAPGTAMTGQAAGMTNIPIDLSGASAIRVENLDVYVVSGNMIYKFDRDLNLQAQAMLSGLAGTSVALQPGQTAYPSTAGMVRALASSPSITIRNDDVYVVAGTMVHKFDRDLNAKMQAALPFAGGTAFAMVPGTIYQYGYGQAGQIAQVYPYGQVTTYGQVAQAQPLVCPPGTVMMQPGTTMTPGMAMGQPGVVMTQPGVAGFREQPPQRWTANLTGDSLQINTSGRGDAEFWLSNAGQTLNYRVNVRNLRNITGVDLRLVQPGMPIANSVVVAPLYSPRRATGSVTGRLTTGSLTARDLTGPYAGQPLSALADAINQGRAVVSIRTTNHPQGEVLGSLTASMQ